MPMNPRLLRPLARFQAPAPAFSPSSITGLQLWLDAADSSTLFDAATGGSLVAADGGVGRWEDKSGFGRHFTQGVANNRPLRRAAGRNGLGTLEFDGSNDFLSGGAIEFARTNEPFTVVMVHVVNASSGTYSVMFDSKTNQTENLAFLNSTDFGGAGYGDYTLGAFEGFAPARFTSAARDIWRYILFAYDGSSPGVDGYSARAGRADLERFAAGGYGNSTGDTALGALDGGVAGVEGQISEVIIYSRLLTAGEKNALENYLHEKWDL